MRGKDLRALLFLWTHGASGCCILSVSFAGAPETPRDPPLKGGMWWDLNSETYPPSVERKSLSQSWWRGSCSAETFKVQDLTFALCFRRSAIRATSLREGCLIASLLTPLRGFGPLHPSAGELADRHLQLPMPKGSLAKKEFRQKGVDDLSDRVSNPFAYKRLGGFCPNVFRTRLPTKAK